MKRVDLYSDKQLIKSLKTTGKIQIQTRKPGERQLMTSFGSFVVLEKKKMHKKLLYMS